MLCFVLRTQKGGKYYICDQREEALNVLVFLIKAGKTAWIEGCFHLAAALQSLTQPRLLDFGSEQQV